MVDNNILLENTRPIVRKENLRDASLYLPEILMYPQENRININFLTKSSVDAKDRGFYRSGDQGPLFFFLTRAPTGAEISEIIDENGLAGTPTATLLDKALEGQNSRINYQLIIKSNDSRAVKHGQSYLMISFDRTKGASYATDLDQEQARFVIEMLKLSLEFTLRSTKSGLKKSEIPPRISHDPLYLTMTDNELEQEMSRMHVNTEEVSKLKKQRNAIGSELQWLIATIQEIQTKFSSDPLSDSVKGTT